MAVEVSEVDVAVRGSSMEGAFDPALLGLPSSVQFAVMVEVKDWQDSSDRSDTPALAALEGQVTKAPVPPDPDIEVSPDNSGVFLPGTIAIYTHSVTNTGTGRAREIFNLDVSSSAGFNISIYDGSKLMATDLNGDGVWDVISPQYDKDGDGAPDVQLKGGEGTTITVQIEIPLSTLALDDTTVLTATHNVDGSITDFATDYTMIPEYDIIWALASVGLLAGYVYYTRKKKGTRLGDTNTKEECENE